MSKSFAIIGCGRVGTSLARYLAEVGYTPSGFASRSISSARRAAEAAGAAPMVSMLPWEITAEADIVLITTPDGAIRETAEKLAEYKGIREGAVALHCSGALPSTELTAIAETGVHIGSMHPLQSFAAESAEENPFTGIMMAVEGSPEAVEAARQMAEQLGASPFEIQTDKKPLYHASAVVASNYLVTLMNLSFQLLMISGVPVAKAFAILKPLVQGTLSNIENAGIPRALTGPIARGDAETVARHLSEIGEKAPTRLSLYGALGWHTIEIALAKGDLSAETAEKLKTLLSPSNR